MAALPLTRHERFHSSDLDEVREQVARVFCDHRLTLGRGERRIDARQHVAQLGELTISYLDYGGAVEIDPGPLETFYLVQIPLDGHALTRCGGAEIDSSPTLASVPHPDDDLRMEWTAGCPHLIVRFERPALERRLEAALGRPRTAPLRFELGLDLTGVAGARWRLALLEALATADTTGDRALATRTVEEALCALLLESQPSNYTAALRSGGVPPGPRAVRAAVEFVEEHLAEPIGVTEIAAAAGVSVRSLQLGFERTVGRPPMRYLRDRRLDRVRELLRAGDLRVTDAALRCGFAHLGRFSAAYRDRFGETPSTTAGRRTT